MTVRHAATPVIIPTKRPQSTDTCFNRSLLGLLSRPGILHSQKLYSCFRVGLLAIIIVSLVAASARGSEDGHATAEHPGHGEGHSEIGANPPPGVEREDFELSLIHI